jgi:hypothetical protein
MKAYYAFDLLHLGGSDYRRKPLAECRAAFVDLHGCRRYLFSNRFPDQRRNSGIRMLRSPARPLEASIDRHDDKTL